MNVFVGKNLKQYVAFFLFAEMFPHISRMTHLEYHQDIQIIFQDPGTENDDYYS